ncbi:hypothetical protein TOTORO_02040 [Serratia phage vB_SmaS-Totoro]|nr:hypothetical protein TOTORO_02040 [Serratia phage vB_SmaS-Totoro]
MVQQVKISELGKVNNVRETDVIPLNNTTTGGKPITKGATVDDLRSSFNFDNAFKDVATGLTFANDNEAFYVFEDESKVNVVKYLKMGSVAEPVIGEDGKQISYPTPRSAKGINGILKSDGYKDLGKVAYIADLASVEPTKPQQSIIVEHAVEGGPALNMIYYYDNTYHDGPIDGVLRVATNEGKVWVLDTSAGVNVMVFGFVPAMKNLAETINKGVRAMVNLAIANVGTFGTFSHLIVPGVNPSTGLASYTMNETIKLPSFIGLQFTCTTLLDFSGRDIDGIVIDNTQFPGATDANLIKWYNTQSNGVTVIDCPGKVIVKGRGAGVSTMHGVWLGNTAKGFVNCRDVRVANVTIVGFKYGLRHDGVDSYLNLFDRVFCARNETSLYFKGTGSGNAGEKIAFHNCTFSDTTSHNVIMDIFAFEIAFDNCSFDYQNGDVFFLGKSTTHGWVKLTNCHLEGFDGYLINQPDKWTGTGQKFYFVNSQVYAVYATKPFSPPRKILDGELGAFYVSFQNSPINFRNKGTKTYGTLTGWGKTNDNTTVTGSVIVNMSRTDPCYLISYNVADNRRYKFTGTAGNTVTSPETSTGISFITRNGTVTVTYGAVGDDGLQTLIINSSANTAEIDLVFPERVPVLPRDMFNTMISVKQGIATGDVKVTGIARCFDDPVITGKKNSVDDNIAITTTYPVLGTTADRNFLLSEALTETNTPLGINDFISTPPLTSTVWNATKTASFGFRINGFTGSIEVKLPVFWKVK